MIKTSEYIYLTGRNVYKELEVMAGVYLQRGMPFFFDTETTGLNPRKDKLICLQFAQEGRTPVILDVRGLDLLLIGNTLKALFGGVVCVGMNLKFDYSFVLKQLGVRILKPFDVMLADQLIKGLGKSDGRKMGVGFDLKSIANRYNIQVSKEERNWFVGLDEREEWKRPLPHEQLLYGAQDVTVLQPIYAKQQSLIPVMGLEKVVDLEMKALPALAEVELAGVKVNVDEWRAVILEQEEAAKKAEEEALAIFGPAILSARARKYDEEKAVYDEWVKDRDAYLEWVKGEWEKSGNSSGWGEYKKTHVKAWRDEHPKPKTPKADTTPPNISSHAQMVSAFQIMNIPSTSTADDQLRELEDEYPQVKVLRRYSKMQKFVTSFGDALLEKIDPSDGRIHPEYQQIGASTGRMSCTNPNFQQIPSRDETGQRLRRCVIAEPGNKILTADYSSIEPRILAEVSGDPLLLDQFDRGVDIYSDMAIRILGLPEGTNVKKEHPKLRSIFKQVVLGVMYGMGAFTMSANAGISQEEAEKHLEGFFKLYPGVQKWVEERVSTIRQTGVARTLSGRHRTFDIPKRPVYPSVRNEVLKEEWKMQMKEYNRQMSRIERQARNTPIQGTSADITKLAVYKFWNSCYNIATDIKTIAVVHDEIVVECPADVSQTVSRMLAKAMDQAAKHFLKRVLVPLPDVVIADYWSKE
jgi:DNA polymerase I-like protein with 3'-5' exonuclease and polymerase domains